MKKPLVTYWALIISSSFAASAAAKTSDPCDFESSGNSAFPYAQVMSCYRQVPFSAAALHNIVQVVEQHRSFSDLGEIYDARIHWKRALAALDAATSEHAYPNDFALHEALKREHKEFRDAHVAYEPPACYWRMLNAFMPLEFGSMVLRAESGQEQIVFVEDAPVLPDLYHATAGIDARNFVGLRVISINGVPVLDYFRQYAEQQKNHEDAGGALNGVLADFDYSIRFGGSYDSVPDRGEDTYVFESVDGRRQVATLPWVFALSSQILGDFAAPLPPSTSTEEFVRLCEQGPAGEARSATGVAQRAHAWGLHLPVDRYRHEAVRRLRAQRHPHVARNGYFEVAPERLGENVQEIIALTQGARVVQVDHHVTALQLGDTLEWADVARQGIEYACAHSDRLVIDVRSNHGGGDTVIRWLHHFLFPEDGTLVAAGLLPVRLRNDNPTFNEVLSNFARATAEFLPELGNDPCALFFVPGCLADVDRGTPLSSSRYDWFLRPTQDEWRGGQLVTLSRQVGLPNYFDPTFDSASCVGRFAGDDLVIVTNGSNASGGYFLPAAFKGDGVIVNTGGILGEPMAMGRARGGATIPGSIWAEAAQWVEIVSSGQITFKHRVEADLRVYVWTNQAGSEDFVYDRVLRAVEERRGANSRK